MSEMYSAIGISASGMRAQGSRIRIISENIANADTAAAAPGENPYTRKQIIFKNVLDREMDVKKVEVDKIREDQERPYPMKFMPDHPGADENGFVKMPNVDPLIEMMDMREAQRTYEANLGMVEQSRNMIMQTIDILRR